MSVDQSAAGKVEIRNWVSTHREAAVEVRAWMVGVREQMAAIAAWKTPMGVGMKADDLEEAKQGETSYLYWWRVLDP